MNLQTPDFQLGPFKLGIDEYQFPDATDYWDANWLFVQAEIDLPGQAWVHARGPFVMTSELARFRDEMQMIYDHLDGEAGLWTIEPEPRLGVDKSVRETQKGRCLCAVPISAYCPSPKPYNS